MAWPFLTLRREIDHLLNDFEGSWQSPLRRAGPNVEPIRGDITSGLMRICGGPRIAVDGAPAEAVDAEAKDLAAKRLTQLAARKAAKRAAEIAAPAPTTQTMPETAERLRRRMRALLRRNA